MMNTEETHVSNPTEVESPKLGVIFALLSAASFGILTTVAKLAYEGGANAITVAAVRSAFAVVAALVIGLILGKTLKVKPTGYKSILLVTVGVSGMSICLLSTVQYISVSLGAILFYTYPLVILAIQAVISREFPGPIRLVTFGTAFCGLLLALGPSFENMDWRGIAFGIGASLSSTLLFFATRTATKHTNEISLILWSNLFSIGIMTAVMPFMGGYHLPSGNVAYLGLFLASFMYVSAFIFYNASLKHIHPAKAAMFYNLEPVISLIAAALILNEVLTPIQLAGAILVLAALMLSAWRSKKQL